MQLVMGNEMLLRFQPKLVVEIATRPTWAQWTWAGLGGGGLGLF